MNQPRRNSLRLRGYDYASAGAYFVTICTHQREHLFEEHILRVLVEEEWGLLPERFSEIGLDEWVVMPNHFHGIICLSGQAEAVGEVRPTLAKVVGVFKSRVAVRWLAWIDEYAPGRSGRIWQRGYYDRIIRSERELNNVRRYIRDNPRRWAEERDNLDALIGRMDAHP